MFQQKILSKPPSLSRTDSSEENVIKIIELRALGNFCFIENEERSKVSRRYFLCISVKQLTRTLT